MNKHPDKLIVCFPTYEPRDYRKHLAGTDARLVVHRRSPIHWLFGLRPVVKLSAGGRHTYTGALLALAADLEAGYTVVVVDRDPYLDDLERLARQHARPKDRDAVERAVQIVTERTATQVQDHMDTDDNQYTLTRAIVGARKRRTEPNRHDLTGVPTPRAEELWRTMCHEWTDVRSNQAARVAYEKWVRRNRPDMPRAEA